jgi:ElaB/YqjD/DUF883 family membrane-anchored ribosome-binding protein
MSATREPSVDQLREESERSREALASTVGALRDTIGDAASEFKTLISPAHIKQEIKDYVREEREGLVQSLQRRAKENPLQVAAVGAAVAYPAWSLLRAIPTPLLLIGAGLFLTSQRGQQSAKDIKAKVDDVMQQGTEKVSDLAGAVRSDLEDRIAGARYEVEEMRDTITSAAGAVVGQARTAFQGAADTAKDAVKDASGKTAEAVGSGADAAADMARVAKDGAAAAATRSRNAVTGFVNDNALLVAGIGAAVGAFIAASIPASDAENRLFGAGSEKLKDKAREAAAQGIEAAGDIASEAAGSVAAAAAREGLDASGVQRALNKVADSVRAVADRGLETALGANSQSAPQTTSERNAS